MNGIRLTKGDQSLTDTVEIPSAAERSLSLLYEKPTEISQSVQQLAKTGFGISRLGKVCRIQSRCQVRSRQPNQSFCLMLSVEKVGGLSPDCSTFRRRSSLFLDSIQKVFYRATTKPYARAHSRAQ